ncbi:hypothetical protein Mp_1g26100 [Marchantia polymorpha subsp. ruderalis]|uniref:Uncharacterized protein n=2 Tax=Marchantia polymorpha TaxID=3197 RepID=A0AAF6AUE6_MARPO|nr:hypothetical protein MARPO_0002s0266 [Marchantia polymorpha]BBN00067.1 hypothetical protein Mp_1g26100 [Marchantia polymorpha subsp. ruderalis]|eukprot:PTQ49816.1 hypothetical protein MARPO_0002s0266 [Marchantia polymorpha]
MWSLCGNGCYRPACLGLLAAPGWGSAIGSTSPEHLRIFAGIIRIDRFTSPGTGMVKNRGVGHMIVGIPVSKLRHMSTPSHRVQSGKRPTSSSSSSTTLPPPPPPPPPRPRGIQFNQGPSRTDDAERAELQTAALHGPRRGVGDPTRLTQTYLPEALRFAARPLRRRTPRSLLEIRSAAPRIYCVVSSLAELLFPPPPPPAPGPRCQKATPAPAPAPGFFVAAWPADFSLPSKASARHESGARPDARCRTSSQPARQRASGTILFFLPSAFHLSSCSAPAPLVCPAACGPLASVNHRVRLLVKSLDTVARPDWQAGRHSESNPSEAGNTVSPRGRRVLSTTRSLMPRALFVCTWLASKQRRSFFGRPLFLSRFWMKLAFPLVL